LTRLKRVRFKKNRFVGFIFKIITKKFKIEKNLLLGTGNFTHLIWRRVGMCVGPGTSIVDVCVGIGATRAVARACAALHPLHAATHQAKGPAAASVDASDWRLRLDAGLRGCGLSPVTAGMCEPGAVLVLSSAQRLLGCLLGWILPNEFIDHACFRQSYGTRNVPGRNRTLK
jgi:hypothetical protein